MGMGEQHGVELLRPGVEKLLAQIGRRVDQDGAAVMLDEDRDAAPAVPRLGRIALAPIAADQRHAARRAAAEDPDFMRRPGAAPGSAALSNKRKKFSVVTSAKLVRREPAQFRQQRRGMHDESRLVALAAMRHRRQIRRIGLDQHAGRAARPGDAAQLLGLLEGDNAGERDIEAEVRSPSQQVPARS